MFTQPDQVHLNDVGDILDARLWHEHLLRYDRGELKRSLESAWGPNWKTPVTLEQGLRKASSVSGGPGS